MSRGKIVTRTDPELGLVKTCTRCHEEWPLDEEFWYFQDRPAGSTFRSRGKLYTRKRTTRVPYAYCKACFKERHRLNLPWKDRGRTSGITHYQPRRTTPTLAEAPTQ